MVSGKAWPIIPPPAATSTRKKVPSNSENSRRHSWDVSWKSSTMAWKRAMAKPSSVSVGPGALDFAGRLAAPVVGRVVRPC